jgi:hypothetical protein
VTSENSWWGSGLKEEFQQVGSFEGISISIFPEKSFI